MTIDDLPAFIREYYEIHEWRHASAVLATDFPDQWSDIIAVLTDFRLKKSAVSIGGGNKSPIANEVDAAFETEAGLRNNSRRKSSLMTGEDNLLLTR